MIKPESIKDKLKNLAKEYNKPFDYFLTHYFIERFLYRLSISNYNEKFVLKGGVFLYMILGNGSRATRDVDFLARSLINAENEIKALFQDICKVEADDAVVFDPNTIVTEHIKEDADYHGIRVKLIGYMGKIKNTLQFDIGFGDIVIPKPLVMEYPSLLDMEKAKIMAYSIESVIAEKFEAMIYLALANSRMKDFYDIYTLCTKYDFDGIVLYEALSQTLDRRGTPLSKVPIIFKDEFLYDKSKNLQWKAFKKRIGENSEITLETILKVIKIFLCPIYESVICEKEYFGKWNHERLTWENIL